MNQDQINDLKSKDYEQIVLTTTSPVPTVNTGASQGLDSQT